MFLGKRNPKVVEVRQLMRSARDRLAQGVFILEGPRSLAEALAGQAPIKSIFCETSFLKEPENQDLIKQSEDQGAQLYEVEEATLDYMVDVRSANGVAAMVAMPVQPTLEELVGKKLDLLLVEGVQDPGNLGALVRVAAAAGLGGVVADAVSADPFSPKAVRGGAAAILRTPAFRCESLFDLIEIAKGQGYQVMASVARDGKSPLDVDLTGPVVFLMGGEGGGLTHELVDMAHERLTIPMDQEVESLNVAVAGALLAYEAKRQKSHQVLS